MTHVLCAVLRSAKGRRGCYARSVHPGFVFVDVAHRVVSSSLRDGRLVENYVSLPQWRSAPVSHLPHTTPARSGPGTAPRLLYL